MIGEIEPSSRRCGLSVGYVFPGTVDDPICSRLSLDQKDGKLIVRSIIDSRGECGDYGSP
jgi:hypothetical protein